MARNQKDFTFDANLQLKDAGAVTADGADQVSAANKILDLGVGRFDGRCIVDVSAIDVSSGDENYLIKTQFSSTSDFSAGVIGGPILSLGKASTLVGESADSVVGRYELPFSNEINGTTYRYMRSYHDVSGTTPSINYKNFVVQQLR